jgi:hypothetical protein
MFSVLVESSVEFMPWLVGFAIIGVFIMQSLEDKIPESRKKTATRFLIFFLCLGFFGFFWLVLVGFLILLGIL